MHVSLSGGGSRALVFAAFFDTLSKSPDGRKFLAQITSYSGVSAGALIVTPLCCGVPTHTILKETKQSGLSKTFYYFRLIGTLIGVKESLYRTDHLYQHMCKICQGKTLQKPVSLAVTNLNMQQKCVQFSKKSTYNTVANCAAASAAVPGLFEKRYVTPIGKCFDGGAVRCTFAVDTLLHHIRSGKPVLMFNSAPWPGFRVDVGGFREKLVAHTFDNLNTHGLEWLPKELGPGFRYQDGIFKFKNVTFVAPTSKQYQDSHGTASAGNIFFSENCNFTQRLTREGELIAESFLKLKRKRII